jgi:hypothetical protein
VVGSPVLAAMGVPAEWARGTLRLSTGRHTTMDEVEAAAKLLIEAAAAQGVECVKGAAAEGLCRPAPSSAPRRAPVCAGHTNKHASV